MGTWTFDDPAVAGRCVDEMARSIPGYDDMRKLVGLLVDEHVRPHSAVIELGAGDGEGIAQLARRHPHNRFYAVETAPAMLDALRRRLGDRPNVRIIRRDLSRQPEAMVGYAYASVVLAVLVLQFVDPQARASILHEALGALKPGGAIVLVEKIKSWDNQNARLFRDVHHRVKLDNGYTKEEVHEKELALEGVLRPLTVDANMAALRNAGFAGEECFWRSLNFAGFIARRPVVA